METISKLHPAVRILISVVAGFALMMVVYLVVSMIHHTPFAPDWLYVAGVSVLWGLIALFDINKKKNKKDQ